MTEHNLYGFLTLLKNNTVSHKHKLSPKAWTIGGGLSNDIRFLTVDEKLLNTKCILMVQENGVAILKNKKSMLPITVNKKKLNACKVLEPGDIIEIASRQFIYENDVLSKKKIKELSSNIKPGFVLKIPSTNKHLEKRRSSLRKLQLSTSLTNKNAGFNSEKVSPGKLLPTKGSQLLSTSCLKTPVPDKSSHKPPTRISVSTEKIYKFRKPTATRSNKKDNVPSHIPVLNKKSTPSERIRTNIKLEMSYVLDTPVTLGKQEKLTPVNKTSKRSSRKCMTDIKSRNCGTKNANKSLNLSTTSMKLESSSDEKKPFSRSEAIQNLAEIATDEGEASPESNKSKVSEDSVQDLETEKNNETFESRGSPANLRHVSSRRSKQEVEELEKSNLFSKSRENIKTRYSLEEADLFDSTSDSLKLFKNMSLNENSLEINRKSSRRSSKRPREVIGNTSLRLKRSNSNGINDAIMQKSPKVLRVSSMIKFSPVTPGFKQKSRTSFELKSNTKTPYNTKQSESLFSTSTDKENTPVTETNTEDLNSSEELYRTPDSVAKIPKHIPKTPKSNVKVRKSVFLQRYEPDEITTNANDLAGNDTTIIDNNLPQTLKTPKSNRKVRISQADNLPVGQPSIVKDLRKSIASPEGNFRKDKSESFLHLGNISTKSVASINPSFVRESNSRPRRSSSILKSSSKSSGKISIKSNIPNVSTPKSNIKIRHSATFEITADDLESLAQSSLRESNGVINLNEISKPKERSVITYTEVGDVNQSSSKTRQRKRPRSSIHICLPEKRQKIDDEYSSFEDEYDQQVLQHISNDSSFEDCIDTDNERKTPSSERRVAQRRGFTDPKKTTEKYKRRSLPAIILPSRENNLPNCTNDNDYSFISSTDTSSIIFAYHPATNPNNMLENNVTLRPFAMDISGVENLNNSRSRAKTLKEQDQSEMQENVSSGGHCSLRGAKEVSKTVKARKEPFSSYENVAGLKRLFKSPKAQKEPASSYEDVRGIKKLFRTLKSPREPESSYENVSGVKNMFKSPKEQKEPFNSYENVRGVKTLFASPKFQKEPRNTYENVAGLKNLFKSPKIQKKPHNSYENVQGVNNLFVSPKYQKEPLNTYENVQGVKDLFTTPKIQNGPQNTYENVEGVEELFKTPALTYTRKKRKNTADDDLQTSQKTKINTAETLSESEDAEKDAKPFRRTRRQIKQQKNELKELAVVEENKSPQTKTRKLRKNKTEEPKENVDSPKIKRPRRKNNDTPPQNDVIESGRSLRSRRQKKTDAVENGNETEVENSAKKTEKEEIQLGRNKRTLKVTFENSSFENTPTTVRETRKRTRKNLSKDDEKEAESKVIPLVEKRTKRNVNRVEKEAEVEFAPVIEKRTKRNLKKYETEAELEVAPVTEKRTRKNLKKDEVEPESEVASVTEKRTRRNLKKDETETESEVVPVIEKRTTRAKKAAKVEEEVTPIRKSTRRKR